MRKAPVFLAVRARDVGIRTKDFFSFRESLFIILRVTVQLVFRQHARERKKYPTFLLASCSSLRMPNAYFFPNGSILFSINSFLEVLPLEICGLCSFCFFRIAKSSINSSYRSFSSFIFCSNSRSEGWKQRRETLIHFMPFLTINDASLSLFLAILFHLLTIP